MYLPRNIAGTILLSLVLVLGAGAASACKVAGVGGAAAIIRPEARIDQRLIDAAIRAEVNYHRCRAGLRPVAGSAGLARVAANHAKWMARADTVSHQSTTAGQSSLKARIKSSGMRFRAAAENIGALARYRFGDAAFRIGSSSGCVFSTAAGESIGPHSYASLARSMVAYWMASPGHRKNILDRRFKALGSGVGFNAAAPYCGRYYLAQDFTG